MLVNQNQIRVQNKNSDVRKYCKINYILYK